MPDLRYGVRIETGPDGTIEAVNRAGDRLTIGPAGTPGAFTPVELLLAAVGGCGALDLATALAGEPEPPTCGTAIAVEGRRRPEVNRVESVALRYEVEPEGVDLDAVAAAIGEVADQRCTIALTLRHGAEVTHELTAPDPTPTRPGSRRTPS